MTDAPEAGHSSPVSMAIQALIATAARNRVPIIKEQAIEELRGKLPLHDVSDQELEEVLRQAASEAGLTVLRR